MAVGINQKKDKKETIQKVKEAFRQEGAKEELSGGASISQPKKADEQKISDEQRLLNEAYKELYGIVTKRYSELAPNLTVQRSENMDKISIGDIKKLMGEFDSLESRHIEVTNGVFKWMASVVESALANERLYNPTQEATDALFVQFSTNEETLIALREFAAKYSDRKDWSAYKTLGEKAAEKVAEAEKAKGKGGADKGKTSAASTPAPMVTVLEKKGKGGLWSKVKGVFGKKEPEPEAVVDALAPVEKEKVEEVKMETVTATESVVDPVVETTAPEVVIPAVKPEVVEEVVLTINDGVPEADAPVTLSAEEKARIEASLKVQFEADGYSWTANASEGVDVLAVKEGHEVDVKVNEPDKYYVGAKDADGRADIPSVAEFKKILNTACKETRQSLDFAACDIEDAEYAARLLLAAHDSGVKVVNGPNNVKELNDLFAERDFKSEVSLNVWKNLTEKLEPSILQRGKNLRDRG